MSSKSEIKNILIVDDDTDFRQSISKALRGSGYRTDEASSGKGAIEKAASDRFDIVLLDLMMPDMSGIDVLTELRRIRPKTKVIMITAFATINNAVESIKRGASDYISKPFKINELLTTIRRVLEEVKFEEGIEKLDLDSALFSLSSPIRRGIMRTLSFKESMRLMEITKELAIEDHTKVVFHLKMLKAAGIIQQNKEKTYSITNKGKKTLSYLKVLETHISS